MRDRRNLRVIWRTDGDGLGYFRRDGFLELPNNRGRFFQWT